MPAVALEIQKSEPGPFDVLVSSLAEGGKGGLGESLLPQDRRHLPGLALRRSQVSVTQRPGDEGQAQLADADAVHVEVSEKRQDGEHSTDGVARQSRLRHGHVLKSDLRLTQSLACMVLA